MAGTARFESSSASSEELSFSPSYSNGQRGSYLGASLDRSGSFREGSESRMFNSMISTPRGRASSTGEIPPLSHCLTLEPITIGDRKCTRSGELRKILGISSVTTSEDNCFGASHLKAPPQVVTEEIKRFKTDVEDVNMNARVRTKMFVERLNNLRRYGDSLNKSSKCREVPNTKKQQRNMMLINERSVGSSLLKAGSQIHRNPSDPLTHRPDDRSKNVVLNRRVRTSVAEIRAEGRGSNIARQSICMGKERDVPRDVVEGSDLAGEKIRRLPTGGEGWDKKMKRKRSVGGVVVRSSDGDGDPKRTLHHKLNSEPVLQSCDGQGFRSGPSNGGSRVKLDANSQPSSSNARLVPKSDLEKVSVSKDFATGLSKERLVVKGSKLNDREDIQIVRSTNMTKGKATRAPRSGPMISGNSSPNFSRPSGAVEVWEQPPALNRIQSVSGMNRKRPLPAGSSSPPMAQWVGQRPQKISRTRRANLVSPVSNHDEVQMSSEGGASDIGSKLTSGGVCSSQLEKGNPTGTHNFKIKTENVRSPTQFSESEESGAGGDRDIRSKEKRLDSGEADERGANSVQNVVPSMAITKKNKMSTREDIGDGVRRQGRSGRASSFSRVGFSPVREKLETPAFTKPLRSAKPMSDKNGSKSGRPPLNKLSDRKVNRPAKTPSSSPDFTGESEDDREDLVAAANFACNASYLCCSGKFWKRTELVFSTVNMEDIDYLKQEVKSAEELHESVSQMVGDGNNDPGDPALDEHSLSSLVPWDENRRQQGQSASTEPLSTVGQIQDSSYFCGRIDSQGRKEVTPLYQRVLSALIVEDEMEEFEEDGAGRAMSFQYHGDDFLPNNVENGHREQIELGNNSISGLRTQKECILDSYACNGNTPFMRGTNIQNLSCRENFFQGNHQLGHPQVKILPELFENEIDGPVAGQRNAADMYGSWYEHMCLEERLLMELQSVDIYPEKVPELSDGDEAIKGEISKLEKELNQKIGKKKAHFGKLLEAAQKGKESEERALEEVAMDRLVELAYQKKLATRKNTSRCGVPKVSKQVANAFMKRTLARLRKYEETSKSPFSERALRDVLLAPPPRINIEDIIDSPSSGASDAARKGNHPSDQDFAKTGPILNRGKKKEVLLDDVGGNSSLRFSSSFGGNLSGGAKGKRSESKTGRVERKTKTKPKQKTGQLSTPGSIPCENATNKRKDIRTVSSGNVPKASFNDVDASAEHPPHDLDSIEDLGGNDDFSNFLNFDDVGLQDSLQDNDVMGLDIPMDDLSDLMFG